VKVVLELDLKQYITKWISVSLCLVITLLFWLPLAYGVDLPLNDRQIDYFKNDVIGKLNKVLTPSQSQWALKSQFTIFSIGDFDSTCSSYDYHSSSSTQDTLCFGAVLSNGV
jgi:hypothetical protein